MFSRVEYGHYYKWLTSIGLALVVASVAVPWFLHQSTAALSIPKAELADLTETAQGVIQSRQQDLAFLQTLEIWIFLVLFLAGIAITTWGLIGWKRRQRKIDAGEDFDLETKRLQYENLSAGEQQEKYESEVRADDGDSDVVAPLPTPDAGQAESTQPSHMAVRIAELRDLEAQTSVLLEGAFGSTHKVTQHVKVRTSVGVDVAIDAVADDPTGTWATVVQDTVRATNAATVKSRMRESILRIAYVSYDSRPTSIPGGDPSRPLEAKATGVVLLVIEFEIPERLQSQIELEVRQVNAVLKRPVAVVLISRAELDGISADSYYRAISGVLREPGTASVLL